MITARKTEMALENLTLIETAAHFCLGGQVLRGSIFKPEGLEAGVLSVNFMRKGSTLGLDAALVRPTKP
jgi:hypothetical protein